MQTMHEAASSVVWDSISSTSLNLHLANYKKKRLDQIVLFNIFKYLDTSSQLYPDHHPNREKLHDDMESDVKPKLCSTNKKVNGIFLPKKGATEPLVQRHEYNFYNYSAAFFLSREYYVVLCRLK